MHILDGLIEGAPMNQMHLHILNKKINQRHHLDNLRMSAWIHQMSAIWNLNWFMTTVGIGAISAWYYLFDKCSYVLSSAVLFISSLLLYLTVHAIRRQVQILRMFAIYLEKAGVWKKEKNLVGLWGLKKYGKHAADIAWLIPMSIIYMNILIGIYTFYLSGYSIYIFIILGLQIVLFSKWEKIAFKVKKYVSRRLGKSCN
jgi:hypothetical protein